MGLYCPGFSSIRCLQVLVRPKWCLTLFRILCDSSKFIAKSVRTIVDRYVLSPIMCHSLLNFHELSIMSLIFGIHQSSGSSYWTVVIPVFYKWSSSSYVIILFGSSVPSSFNIFLGSFTWLLRNWLKVTKIVHFLNLHTFHLYEAPCLWTCPSAFFQWSWHNCYMSLQIEEEILFILGLFSVRDLNRWILICSKTRHLGLQYAWYFGKFSVSAQN